MENTIEDIDTKPITNIEDNKKYVVACMRHTGSGDYAICLWGPNSSGYTPNLLKVGIYTEKEITRFTSKDDFPIELEYAKSISVEREYNYNSWELGRFILNDELFRNTFSLPKKAHYKSPSDKQYFRYKGK